MSEKKKEVASQIQRISGYVGAAERPHRGGGVRGTTIGCKTGYTDVLHNTGNGTTHL